MLRGSIFILFVFIFKNLSAQEKFTFYNTTNGLPSNHVYKCLADKKGFLWVATENGLTRFDGVHFTNFTTKDGLSDNDILDIFLDKKDNLWVLPFNNKPVFVDATTFQIINATKNPELAKLNSKNILLGNTLSNGEIAFYDGAGNIFIWDKNKLKEKFKIKVNELKMYTKVNGADLAITEKSFLYRDKAGQVIEKNSQLGFPPAIRFGEENGNILIPIRDSAIVQISNFNKNLEPTFIKKKFSFRTWNVTYLKKYIGVAARNGILYFLDKNTLEIVKYYDLKANVVNVSEDDNGNYWVATEDKGIVKISNTLIAKINLPYENFKEIQSFYVDSTKIIVGNIAGNIIEIKNNQYKIKKLQTGVQDNNNFYIKKIIQHKGNIFLVCFKGLYGSSGNGYVQLGTLSGFKDAILFNDSIILLGTSSAFIQYNINTKQFSKIALQRVSTLSTDKNKSVYLGSNTGLYKWSNNTISFLGDKEKIFSSNVLKLFTNVDSIVWVSLSTDTLLAMKNGRILNKIPLNAITNGFVCKTITGNKVGEIWAGTDRSLVKIKYEELNGKLNFITTLFDKNDGLTDGQINDISIYKDTVYVATTFGLCKFNKNAQPTISDIPVYITKISVNNVDIGVEESLELSSTQNNVQIIFSGIDLSGYVPKFQYQLNNSSWQDITENVLNLTGLDFGNYTVKIRGIKKNSEPSALEAKLKINIKTPFWRNPLFIISLLFISILIFYFYSNKQLLNKQKRKYQSQLDLDNQRLKITADLHDDIGASLSSLQVNSAVANQLIHTNPKQAKIVLEKIEDQSKRLSEKIGDIIWSMKPGKDEFMSFSSRIKTFASDIIGATNIDYTVAINKEVDELLTDFYIRKNIILILKEAINNAVKYSNASLINIDAHIKNNLLQITVADNGVGLPTDNTAGNGLKNMKKRATELNGTFDIKSTSQKGVVIECLIPLSIIH